MSRADRITERLTRQIAQRTSRRSLLTWLGAALAGGSTLPLLPVARASPAADPNSLPPQNTGNTQDPGDPTRCDYWRYCAIDGFLCQCCGGTKSACPPGTEMSPITWIGTCRNPADRRNYIISYNDCCGRSSCGRCLCNNNVGDRPIVRPQSNNDTNWCLGTQSSVYTCSTAIILGVAIDQAAG